MVSRWPELAGRDERFRLIWTQVAHWIAVLVAIRLVFIADVERMMNSDASALAALTLLALGTFTAGVHIASWRICLVGVLLAAGVPGVAWLEQSALLLMLLAIDRGRNRRTALLALQTRLGAAAHALAAVTA